MPLDLELFPADVVASVEKLSPEKKRLLAEALLAEQDDPEVNEADLPPGTKEMLDQRWADYQAGKTKAIPWPEVKAELEREFGL